MRVLFVYIFLSPCILLGQCAEPTESLYDKVLSTTFAKEFEECPVLVKATFFKAGFVTNYRKPKKLKGMYFFQCLNSNQGPKTDVMGNSIGQFFAIDPERANPVLGLKPGDQLLLLGKTVTQNYFGANLSVFFIVDSFEIVNE